MVSPTKCNPGKVKANSRMKVGMRLQLFPGVAKATKSMARSLLSERGCQHGML